MVGITNEEIRRDYETVRQMLHKYSGAIWEGQCGQAAHYDNQQKLVRIGICDVRNGLSVAESALKMLSDVGVEED